MVRTASLPSGLSFRHGRPSDVRGPARAMVRRILSALIPDVRVPHGRSTCVLPDIERRTTWLTRLQGD